MESKRRQKAREDIGLQEKEQRHLLKAFAAEEQRLAKKQQANSEIRKSKVYRLLEKIYVVMDNWFLDPLLGMVPGIGDTVTSVFSLPFLYVSIFKIRSLPLTLAIVYNVMRDVMLGLIPFWIGNFLDALNRCHKQNFRLIVGFVEDDQAVMQEVRRKAVRSAVGIVFLSLIIYALIRFVGWILTKGQQAFEVVLQYF